MVSNGPLTKRITRNRTTSEFLLEHVKLVVIGNDPDLGPESPRFRVAVVLLAAALVAGLSVGLLVRFTGYSMTFVAGIAHRMSASGLWSDDKVCTDRWFAGDHLTGAFWTDCLVAEGLMYVERKKGGEDLYLGLNLDWTTPN